MTDLFDFQAQGNRFAVMGNPVEHSRSPRIHQLFARQFGIDIEYRRIQVDTGGFAQAVSHFAARGGAGLNITVPFKVEAWRLCGRPGNRLSARARHAQAVNTLRLDRKQALFGDNTDGIGLVRDLENNLGWRIAGRRVLILGAGGAVRGVAGALLERRPAGLTIANRTASKSQALAGRLSADNPGGHGLRVAGCGYPQLERAAFDLIINGTSASLGGGLPEMDAGCIGAHSVVYDLMYGGSPTVFMRWACAHGAGQASDGLGMLVEQAAASFHLWHDRRPDTAPVIGALRAALST